MATVDISQPSSAPLPAAGDGKAAKGRTGGGGEALRLYYQPRIRELELQIRRKMDYLRRLEAQRDELKSRVRMLREELQLLQEPVSDVGDFFKVIAKFNVLLKTYRKFLPGWPVPSLVVCRRPCNDRTWQGLESMVCRAKLSKNLMKWLILQTAENRENYDRWKRRMAELQESRGQQQAGNCEAPWQWRHRRQRERGIARRQATTWRAQRRSATGGARRGR